MKLLTFCLNQESSGNDHLNDNLLDCYCGLWYKNSENVRKGDESLHEPGFFNAETCRDKVLEWWYS